VQQTRIWGGFDSEQRAVLDARLKDGATLRAVVMSALVAAEMRDLDEAG
jgi:hypothetical protein